MNIYRVELFKQMEQLSFAKKLVIAALTCEKLYPNYIFFSSTERWGNPQLLEEGISILFQSIFNNSLFSRNDINELILSIESITPDTEEFENISVSFALDACTSVLSGLNYLLDHDIENILDILLYAIDTVDMYIQEKGNLHITNKYMEELIEKDFFMTQEKYRQGKIISILKEVSKIDNNLFKVLREIQPNPIIDLSLI